jgi:hypothetical protein
MTQATGKKYLYYRNAFVLFVKVIWNEGKTKTKIWNLHKVTVLLCSTDVKLGLL